jgi:predicted nucleic acid-binding protein
LSYLIDTNVVSELRKGRRCDPGVAAWFALVRSEDLYLSVLTVGELRKGIESIRRRDQPGAATLEAWLEDLLETYSGRCLPVDRDIAEEWGRLNSAAPLPVIDSLIAATAKVHRLTLVTRNLRDVDRTGVDCINPFRS